MKNLLFIALVVFAISGCSKDEVVGPEGAQGVQGEQGEQGEQGNANIESYDFTIYTSNWEGSIETFWEATIEWDVLTEEMVNEGGVFVYIAFEQNTYTGLPLTLPAGDGFASILSAFRIGELGVMYSPGGGILLNNPGVRQCRAVAIAPKSMALGDDHVQKLIEKELKK